MIFVAILNAALVLDLLLSVLVVVSKKFFEIDVNIKQLSSLYIQLGSWVAEVS